MIPRSIFYSLLWLLTTTCWAQIWQTQSQLGVVYTHQQRSGMLRYMTFHDHTLATPNYHQHLYYNPFTENREYYTYFQLYVQSRLNRRVVVAASMTHHHNWRNEDDGLLPQSYTTNEKGFGDLRIAGHYLLYDSELFSINPIVRQQWWLGGQITLPTGRYDNFNVLNELEPKMQVATGAWQLNPRLHYVLEYQRWQVAAQCYYHYFLQNRFYYRFGNRWQAQIVGQYQAVLGKLRWTVGTGVGYEHRKADFMNRQAIPEDTGGQWWTMVLQSQLQWRAYQLEGVYSLPFVQKLKGRQTQFGVFFQVSVAWKWGVGDNE
ncbi:MAG: transporter [Chitinophagales bacterium]|nr:transporter [Chitinophagales bacterium]